MRRRLLTVLLTAVFLLGLLPMAATPAAGAEPGIKLLGLSLPPEVTAGQSATIRVRVDAEAEGGICCGNLLLEGPDGQDVLLRLRPEGPGVLAAQWAIDPHAAPGTWTVLWLQVYGNTWRARAFDGSTGLRKAIRVIASGQGVDRTPPEVRSISVPPTARAGQPYRIRLRVTDDLSGFAQGYVYMRTDPKSPESWTYPVELRPGDEPQVYTATVLMEPAVRRLHVAEVRLWDRAGNGIFMQQEELERRFLIRATSAVVTAPPVGLLTSPYLKLIHPGELSYSAWVETDRRYLMEQARAIGDDSVAVQERLLAEVALVRATVDVLGREVYTDPKSGLRALPFATMGKLMALNRALYLRTLVLAIAALPEEERTDGAVRWAVEQVDALYRVVQPEERLIDLADENLAKRYGAVAAAYLHLLGQSPEAVAALKTPGLGTEEGFATWDPNLIYFVPVKRSTQYEQLPGRAMLRIAAEADGPMVSELYDLLFWIGHHVGETFLSRPGEAERDARWAPYIALRGGAGWSDGAELQETPAAHLAVDFVQAFAPYGLGVSYRPLTSIPELAADPAVEQRFRAWMQSLLAEPPERPAVSPQGVMQVGVADAFRVEVKGDHPEAKLELVTEMWVGALLNQAIAARPHPERLTFRAPAGGLGTTYLYRVSTPTGDGRQHVQHFMYTRVPVLLKPIPSVTEEASVTVVGTTLPNRVVRIGKAIARASAGGLFSLRVPLQEGANELRLTVQGVELGARFAVYRTTSGEAPPLGEARWLPEIVIEQRPFYVDTEEVTIAGRVEHADNLTFNGEPVALEPDGRFAITLRLEPGERIEVELKTANSYGSQESRWTITRRK